MCISVCTFTLAHTLVLIVAYTRVHTVGCGVMRTVLYNTIYHNVAFHLIIAHIVYCT